MCHSLCLLVKEFQVAIPDLNLLKFQINLVAPFFMLRIRYKLMDSPLFFFLLEFNVIEMVLNCKWTNTHQHEMQWCFCLKFLFSSAGREGFHSVESIVSQQMSLSIGDDSTGSWSNLSFEDEHPDESSSFLHLSDR